MAKVHKVIEVVDISDKTLADSANGKTNAYSHYCTHVMHSKAYATCLHLVEERRKGRLSILYADCSVAIGKKICPAIAMRKQETEAGHALFFKERVKHVGEKLLDAAIGMIAPSKKKFAEPAKSPVTEKESIQPAMGGYSDAINNALKNSAKVETKPEVKVEVEVKPVPKKEEVKVVFSSPVEGESLIELAKRMMAQQA